MVWLPVTYSKIDYNSKWHGSLFKCGYGKWVADLTRALIYFNKPWSLGGEAKFLSSGAEKVFKSLAVIFSIFFCLIVSTCLAVACRQIPNLFNRAVLAGQPQTEGEHGPGGGLVQSHSSRWTVPNNHHWTQVEPGWVPSFCFQNLNNEPQQIISLVAVCS